MNAKENGIRGPDGKDKVGSTVEAGASVKRVHPYPPMKGLHIMVRDAISSQ